MVRDKLAKYTQEEAGRKVLKSGTEMHQVIKDMETRGVDINSPMDVLTEIWNSNLSDYDTAQMLCAIGMHMVKCGSYTDYEESRADNEVEENMAALKKKWGM